jgi:hypothetical protein
LEKAEWRALKKFEKEKGFLERGGGGGDLNSFLGSEFHAGTSEKFPKAEF